MFVQVGREEASHRADGVGSSAQRARALHGGRSRTHPTHQGRRRRQRHPW